jgi:hypothetical protein
VPGRVDVDPDGGQRVTVQGAEQAGRLPEPGPADDLGLHAFRGDAPLAQGGARRFAGGSGGEQEMLTADIAVPQPAGVFLGLHHDGTGAGGEALEHQRLPVRRACVRRTVCPVTPGRPAIRSFFMRVSLC